MDATTAKEIVVSAHESAHAVASVRLGLPFDYVTLDDRHIGPHVQHWDNLPRKIAFYLAGNCCSATGSMCEACRTEQTRAESYVVMALCGSLGAAATGCAVFGYGHDADKAYAVDFCQIAFGDKTHTEVNERIRALLDRAFDLMTPEGPMASAVAKALRERRRLSEAEVKEIMQAIN